LDIAQVFIIKSDYRLGGADYDRILKWMKNMLHEGNNLKDNFYAITFMMKPLGLGYQKKKNPNFYMLYNGEYTNFTECKTYKHA
jgi:hypothetical protein